MKEKNENNDVMQSKGVRLRDDQWEDCDRLYRKLGLSSRNHFIRDAVDFYIWLFPSPYKTEDMPRDPSSCRKALARILERAGCKHVPFHALRHTFASHAFHYGMDVKTLASTIGHESVETTLNVYAHSSEQMKRDAAKKIDESIGRLSEPI